jgi:hypothetical protein
MQRSKTRPRGKPFTGGACPCLQINTSLYKQNNQELNVGNAAENRQFLFPEESHPFVVLCGLCVPLGFKIAAGSLHTVHDDQHEGPVVAIVATYIIHVP